jgi:hypothetical protein
LLIVLMAAGIYSAVRTVSTAASPADKSARQFLQLVNDNNLDHAYGQISSRWQAASSRSDFGDIAGLWRKQLGNIQSVNQTGINFYSGTGGAYITLTYQVHGTRKTAQVTMIMVEENGGWHPQSVNFGL